ncbi:UNKNOWN [Stylonychia lemnae]|uniref:Uncharacterized protein n=1 Tax=Stylonychia lemnae TaxID=5949 RepID=A0A078ASB8_STYLE|nr:UNKNOWN [Stylonychia lemnae]|eukprot:CDW84861.1 UNKNOWN [Stylonychia lemnae]
MANVSLPLKIEREQLIQSNSSKSLIAISNGQFGIDSSDSLQSSGLIMIDYNDEENPSIMIKDFALDNIDGSAGFSDQPSLYVSLSTIYVSNILLQRIDYSSSQQQLPTNSLLKFENFTNLTINGFKTSALKQVGTLNLKQLNDKIQSIQLQDLTINELYLNKADQNFLNSSGNQTIIKFINCKIQNISNQNGGGVFIDLKYIFKVQFSLENCIFQDIDGFESLFKIAANNVEISLNNCTFNNISTSRSIFDLYSEIAQISIFKSNFIDFSENSVLSELFANKLNGQISIRTQECFFQIYINTIDQPILKINTANSYIDMGSQFQIKINFPELQRFKLFQCTSCNLSITDSSFIFENLIQYQIPLLILADQAVNVSVSNATCNFALDQYYQII